MAFEDCEVFSEFSECACEGHGSGSTDCEGRGFTGGTSKVTCETVNRCDKEADSKGAH